MRPKDNLSLETGAGSQVPPQPREAQKQNFHLPPTLFSKRKHPQNRKQTQAGAPADTPGPCLWARAEARVAGPVQMPKAPGKTPHQRLPPTGQGQAADPRPPSHKGTWTGHSLGLVAAGSGPSTARAAVDGGAAMDGAARASHSWAGPTAAQLICTDQAWLSGERPLLIKERC